MKSTRRKKILILRQNISREPSMIDLGALFKILFVFFLALVSPGPDFMIVSSISLSRGRLEGIKAAAGVAAGIVAYTLVCLLGLSALFMQHVWLVLGIKMCGGLYLAYLGIGLIKSSFATPHAEEVVLADVKKKSAFLAGALTNLTNPKAVAFFASVFALALTPETGFVMKSLIGVAIPLETLFWFSFVAFCLSDKRIRGRYQRAKHWIDRGVGGVLGFFGGRLFLYALEEAWRMKS